MHGQSRLPHVAVAVASSAELDHTLAPILEPALQRLHARARTLRVKGSGPFRDRPHKIPRVPKLAGARGGVGCCLYPKGRLQGFQIAKRCRVTTQKKQETRTHSFVSLLILLLKQEHSNSTARKYKQAVSCKNPGLGAYRKDSHKTRPCL